MATREEVDRTLGAYEPGPDDPALSDLMRGHLEAAGAGVEPAGPAVTFHAADPTGPDGDVVLPSAILSDGGGVILRPGKLVCSPEAADRGKADSRCKWPSRRRACQRGRLNRSRTGRCVWQAGRW